MNYKQLDKCRISGSKNLVSILNLGVQSLTGVFPQSSDVAVTEGPLELLLCPDSGLVQLGHSYNCKDMYGENYGYRSGLNLTMVAHLSNKVKFLENLVQPESGDVIVDIGSNDCTTLKEYSIPGLNLIGIDPTGNKFRSYYPKHIKLVPDFFSENAYKSVTNKKAKIVTSIAMFYDLEDPIAFARQIEKILADDGIWHFEQSYLPLMLSKNSYDTICHEHIEYYSLKVIHKILEKADLKLVDVEINDINGGSFAITATKQANTSINTNHTAINNVLAYENNIGLETLRPYKEFENRVTKHKEDLINLLELLKAEGKKVLGYGASTKGNVMLQYCGITRNLIPAIADVNKDKFGCVTPGTYIPIISEAEAKTYKPDYFLVLPWHFRDNILSREKEFIANGGKFIFPFPEIEIV